ncbi:zinc finger X-chromosomal protein-like [Homalodisca vitripennis]|uniref:zinc finger X-chromosomal protein-like n=1 Tax=Homalodisca vitripennis TaxID=197043 RepID=UPI001EEBBFCB|nr:zinc finger X-chromosomal protein-like [Homalodisca vitripennis]
MAVRHHEALSKCDVADATQYSVTAVEDGTKRFVCSKCGRLYKRKNHVVQHLRYECGKEPQFACNYCGFRAKQKSNLKTHVVTRHSEVLTTDWTLK